MNADGDLNAALDLHRAGKLAEAADAYRALLARDPNMLGAVHGLGLVAVDLGQATQGIPLLARCVATQPNDPAYRCSLGLALLKTGQPDAAASALLPAANGAPHLLAPRLLLARALGALKRWTEARDIMNGVTAHFANEAEAWQWRGACENELGDFTSAAASFQRAADLKPGDAEVLNNLGVALRAAGRLEEAAAAYRSALSFAPDHVVSHSNLGNVLGLLGDARSAEFHLRRANVLAPDFIDNHYNLGVHLLRQDRPEEALPHLRRVIAAAPNRPDALTNLGVGLVALGRYDEAERCYRRAIELQPGNGEAHYDLAWLLLLTGRWPEGWTEFEWRWDMPTFSSRRRPFTAPLWDGARVDGTLLIHAEQGLGDAIQFVRFANLAAERCTHLVVECPRPLLSLFTHAAKAGLIAGEIIAIGDPQPPYAAQAPFMTLPRLFRTTPTSVPNTSHYLEAPTPRPDLILPHRGRRRIGLVWAGSPFNKMDSQRSLPVDVLRPVLAATDADFVSLQVGPGAEQAVLLPQDRLIFTAHDRVKDFADTAAIISQLDLVIGVDTAATHLAAALGKPVWLMLAFAPDYRWLLARTDTPWYPSMHLFRQQKRSDWSHVTAALLAKLALPESEK